VYLQHGGGVILYSATDVTALNIGHVAWSFLCS